MSDFLPKLFSYFESKTHQKLTFRPVVYLNYKPTIMSGYQNSGGTLPGLVQLTIEGEKWVQGNDFTLETVIKFLAHESAHFWNGEMFENVDEDGAAWLHEGGADAFAYRALFELGIINQKTLNQKYDNALNRCALKLKQKALNESSKTRQFGNYYDCGSTIMLLVDKALAKKSKDIFDFWNKLLKNSASKNNQYGRIDFHQLLKNEFGEKELSQLIEELELKERDELQPLLAKLFNVAGSSFKNENKNATGEFLNEMKIDLLSRIMKADCNGLVDISGGGKGFLIGGKKQCKNFKSTKYDVIGVEGIQFKEKNNQTIFHLAKESCEKREKIKLNLYQSPADLVVPCKGVQIEQLNWLEIIH
jgi:hypothetical protein